MSVAVITGSAGLIGSEASTVFAGMGLDVVGIDNDMRKAFFGDEASTDWNRRRLEEQLGQRYRHLMLDIRAEDAINRLFCDLGTAIKLVVHTAAQPSHDWAARDPHVDFHVNAVGTLNLLEATRKYAPDAAFIFTSTNKVYGDLPNRLPLEEKQLRFEIDSRHRYAAGISEAMSIDQSMHSVFGASKVAADVLVQEYGRYFGVPTVCFRGGCLTGPSHAGTELHGFLSYLMKCAVTGTPYTVYGYKGKQVRDNIHSADLISAFGEFFAQPRAGEVYNIGGGRFSNASVLEAIAICEELSGRQMKWVYDDRNRAGDHVWWISDISKFQQHYPNWHLRYDVRGILREILEANRARWRQTVRGRSELQSSASLANSLTAPA
jgi:CDP-paratose 2-epimerase